MRVDVGKAQDSQSVHREREDGKNVIAFGCFALRCRLVVPHETGYLRLLFSLEQFVNRPTCRSA